ncbi:MAG: hypothetical protein ACPGVU_23580, partial [Limisphaerales bacterium]
TDTWNTSTSGIKRSKSGRFASCFRKPTLRASAARIPCSNFAWTAAGISIPGLGVTILDGAANSPPANTVKTAQMIRPLGMPIHTRINHDCKANSSQNFSFPNPAFET